MFFGISFFIILGVSLWVLLALWTGRTASRKGHSFAVYFWLGLVPIIGLIAATMVEDRNETAQDRVDEDAVDKVLEIEENK